MFSNMADSVNTSLGVHLFENLQALNVGSKIFKCLPVLYRLCPSYWTKSSRFSFSTAFFFFFCTSYRTQSMSTSLSSLSLSIYLSKQELQQTPLASRWEIKCNIGKVEKRRRQYSCMGALCSLAQNMYMLRYISIFCQGLVEFSTAGQAMKEAKRSRREM